MSEALDLRFENESLQLIDQLKAMFGTNDRAAVVAHALNFAAAAKTFMHDGVVTVFDPSEVDKAAAQEQDIWENALVNVVVNRRDRAGR